MLSDVNAFVAFTNNCTDAVLKLQAALAYMFNAGSARGIACPVDYSRTGVERINRIRAVIREGNKSIDVGKHRRTPARRKRAAATV
ncbi:hypothetical protein PRIPAC_77230 [Pristionchus pacificus]|uniref:Uncharacterized protein n=1 Tax=Pristionchus pacificus TaxID=54126 RepID=A0A2A6CQQ2_PRIPA|nr:hypothetical protein PRIPAC_77230 [Pristionchus pacificus]|eukprot:PDM80387.1 hypothetical protein PRIPAC_32966 [Pristionchus pacificus]